MKKTIVKHYGVKPVEIQFEPSSDNPTQVLRVTRVSDTTGATNSMDLPVTEDQLRNWLEERQLIQNVMPHLSKEQREFLISGSTPEEWKRVCGDTE